MTTIRPYTPTTDPNQPLPPDERATVFITRILERVAQQDAAQAALWQAKRESVRRLAPIPPGRPAWLVDVGMKPQPPNPRRPRWVLFPGQQVISE